MPTKINYLFGFFLSLMLLIFNNPCFAINNPDLLPEDKSPIIDLAKTLSPYQSELLKDVLNLFQCQSKLQIYLFY